MQFQVVSQVKNPFTLSTNTSDLRTSPFKDTNSSQKKPFHTRSLKENSEPSAAQEDPTPTSNPAFSKVPPMDYAIHAEVGHSPRHFSMDSASMTTVLATSSSHPARQALPFKQSRRGAGASPRDDSQVMQNISNSQFSYEVLPPHQNSDDTLFSQSTSAGCYRQQPATAFPSGNLGARLPGTNVSSG